MSLWRILNSGIYDVSKRNSGELSTPGCLLGVEIIIQSPAMHVSLLGSTDILVCPFWKMKPSTAGLPCMKFLVVRFGKWNPVQVNAHLLLNAHVQKGFDDFWNNWVWRKELLLLSRISSELKSKKQLFPPDSIISKSSYLTSPRKYLCKKYTNISMI